MVGPQITQNRNWFSPSKAPPKCFFSHATNGNVICPTNVSWRCAETYGCDTSQLHKTIVIYTSFQVYCMSHDAQQIYKFVSQTTCFWGPKSLHKSVKAVPKTTSFLLACQDRLFTSLRAPKLCQNLSKFTSKLASTHQFLMSPPKALLRYLQRPPWVSKNGSQVLQMTSENV